MAAKLQSVEYAHLCMRTIEWYLKRRWNHVTHGLCHKILVNKDLCQALIVVAALGATRVIMEYFYPCECERLNPCYARVKARLTHNLMQVNMAGS